jgi:ABC-type Zn2+ transport system substrate-binding protein/surface adhesin
VDEVNSVERMFWVGMDVFVDVDVVGKSVGGMVEVEKDGEVEEEEVEEEDGEDREDGEEVEEEDGEDEEDSETDMQSLNPSITALSVNDHLFI